MRKWWRRDVTPMIKELDKLQAENERLRRALKEIAKDYYKQHGGLKDWTRDVLEACIEHDTAIAQQALKELEEEQ